MASACVYLQVVRGRTMEEWLRFSVCFWHTFRGTGIPLHSPSLSSSLQPASPPSGADPFGYPTLHRPWDDGTDSLENAKRRLRAAFEFFSKLGVSPSLHTKTAVADVSF